MDKKIKKIVLCSLIILVIIFVSFMLLFLYKVSPVDSHSDKTISFTIETGTSKVDIVKNLKKKNLIRSEFFAKVILKVLDKDLYAGTYKLSKDMSTNEIINMIANQDNIENETITMTFIEGKRVSTYIKQISEVFNISEEDIKSKISDKNYLETLIDKYWFLSEDILNEEVYVPLEGYLYPDTYEFKKNSTIEDIIDKFLGNLDSKLSTYKDEIEIGKYSVHQYLTLASIVELEGVNSNDRRGVAGVFYNRLNSNIRLGSDVTTYYAVNKDFSNELTWNDLNSCNGYNTRGNCVNALPVGPICNPSLSSIAAVIEPEENDYYYFVADKDKNTYFSKTESEHALTVSKLKSEGKWYTY